MRQLKTAFGKLGDIFSTSPAAHEEEAQALHNPRMHEHEEDAASEHKGNMLRLEEHQ